MTGTISLDGKPLGETGDIRVNVLFQPTGGGAAATAVVDDSGNYSVATGSNQGLREGKYSVSVIGMKLKKAVGNGYPTPIPITPKQYADAATSGLAVDVGPRGANYNLELVSK